MKTLLGITAQDRVRATDAEGKSGRLSGVSRSPASSSSANVPHSSIL
jgi:hypothetical protein